MKSFEHSDNFLNFNFADPELVEDDAGARSTIDLLRSVNTRNLSDALRRLPVPETRPLLALPPQSEAGPFEHMLNFSQRAIVGFRNKHKVSRASGDAMLAMITDPKFRVEDVDSKTILKLEALLEDGYGKDIWEHCGLNDPIDGEQDLKMYM